MTSRGKAGRLQRVTNNTEIRLPRPRVSKRSRGSSERSQSWPLEAEPKRVQDCDLNVFSYKGPARASLLTDVEPVPDQGGYQGALATWGCSSDKAPAREATRPSRDCLGTRLRTVRSTELAATILRRNGRCVIPPRSLAALLMATALTSPLIYPGGGGGSPLRLTGWRGWDVRAALFRGPSIDEQTTDLGRLTDFRACSSRTRRPVMPRQD